MYLALIGRVVEDSDFTKFIASMRHGGPECHTVIDTLASCGYSLLRVSYPSHDNDKEITTTMRNKYYEDEFVDTVDTYSLYQSLNQHDLAEDILLRINVHENDLSEIEEALGEAVRLLRESRMLIEVVTGDAETEDEYWAEPSDEEESRDE